MMCRYFPYFSITNIITLYLSGLFLSCSLYFLRYGLKFSFLASFQKYYACNKTNKLRGLSPQVNYTDRATAAVDEVVPTFAGRGVLCGQRNGFPRPLISVF
jgi:hypothetical protein